MQDGLSILLLCPSHGCGAHLPLQRIWTLGGWSSALLGPPGEAGVGLLLRTDRFFSNPKKIF